MTGPKIDLRERTKSFALDVVRTFSALPKTAEAQILGRQVLRSGTSIGANYREAFRGRSEAEFIAKCGDCLREIEETAYWLELLAESEIVTDAKIAPVRAEWSQREAVRHRRQPKGRAHGSARVSVIS
jgi:four helix bundle protein